MTSATLPMRAATAQADESLTEIVNGEIVEKDMSAGAIWIGSRIHECMAPYINKNRLGTASTELLFILDPVSNLRRRPDWAFVSAARWPFGQMPPLEGDWQIVPDLAVEVVSPNDAMEQVTDKVGEYFSVGTRLVWVVLPKTRVVYAYDSMDRLKVIPSGGALETDLIPGVKLPVAALFDANISGQALP